MASIWTLSSPFLLCKSSLNRRNNTIAYEKRSHTTLSKLRDHLTTMETGIRKSANYPPNLWSYDFVQSLNSKYTGEKYGVRLRTLKEAASTMICKESKNEGNPLKILNLVDDLQRLGISYHFMNEIRNVLESIYHNHFTNQENWSRMDLNLKSLGFRLLRQHGYHVPQEIFEDLKDETRNFKVQLYEDIVGMLNLYEASYLSLENESILDDVRAFTTEFLKERSENIVDEDMSSLISHTLHLPLHWRLPRVEAKWFIDTYERRSDKNLTLMELAKLDFNMVQAIHQEDLKQASRWWKEIHWEKFGFARDRLVETFLWSAGVNHMPHFIGRSTLGQVICMLAIFDDVYDVYGTLPELEQFTDIVTRWDVYAIEELPDYMKIFFHGFYNTVNVISYNMLINKGLFVLPYLKKAWQDYCNSILIETKWYASGYMPTFEEYINNAWVSCSANLMLFHTYLLTLTRITKEAMQGIERAGNIIRSASLILRLTNDLATSSDEQEKGDVPTSIQCYMQEKGATEVEARSYIKLLILETWKKMNKEKQEIGSWFPEELIECTMNMARVGHFVYTDGDGLGYPDVMKSNVLSLLVNPIYGVL